MSGSGAKYKDVADVVHYDEKRRVRVGDMVAALNKDGTITLRGNKLIGREMRSLTREEVQDLLVALDGVLGDQPPTPSADEVRDALINGARSIQRDLYRLSGYPCEVDIGIPVHAFARIASVDNGDGTSSRRIDKYDYERGRVLVHHGIEISVSRKLS